MLVIFQKFLSFQYPPPSKFSDTYFVDIYVIFAEIMYFYMMSRYIKIVGETATKSNNANQHGPK